MTKTFKQNLKQYIPPVLLNKFRYMKAHKGFQQYKDLISKNITLKDKHKCKRCFILGSGPSIKKEDLTPLKDEIVFALNNFYVHEYFDTIMSGDVPKYYMTAPIHPPQSEGEWRAWFSDMEKNMPKNTNMLFGLNGYDGNIRYIFDKYEIFKMHNINWYYAGVDVNEYYQFDKKDIDMTNMVWNSNTVSIYAIMMAIYMGFDKIYLLGMDHTNICAKNNNIERFYTKAKHHKNDVEKNFLDNIEYKKDKFLNTYLLWMKYILLQKLDNKIINLSQDTLLDVFESDKLEYTLIWK